MTTPTRLPKTEKDYGIKARNLCSQAARAFGYESPNHVPLTRVVEYVISRKQTYSRNTWKQYKNALRYHAEMMIEIQNEKVFAEEAWAAIRLLDSETSEGCMKSGTRTSALKQKTFKKADFDKVISFLHGKISKHRYPRTLTIWLKASRLTGLRPSEWEYASLFNSDLMPVLIVRNAKATNGRGNGEERTLWLDLFTKDELEIIQNMIEMVEGYSTEFPFAKLQKLLGDYMNRVTRKCLGKRKKYPTLYSNRHQFSADAKFSGYSKAEVAALLGQASDETAGIHYARKSSGESAIKVSPLPSEVKSVRIRSSTFAPRQKKMER